MSYVGGGGDQGCRSLGVCRIAAQLESQGVYTSRTSVALATTYRSASLFVSIPTRNLPDLPEIVVA